MSIRAWAIAYGVVSVIAVAVVGLGSAVAAEPPYASAWVSGHNSKVRLIADGLRGLDTSGSFHAAVEIQLQLGWKTYWRMPGESGVPPNFDWSAAQNVAETRVLYPAPIRMSDQSGELIGYKTAVTFPVVVKPRVTSQPVQLVVALEYGICRDICIPTEVKLELALPAEPATSTRDAAIALAISKVPRVAAARLPGDPEILEVNARLAGPKPSIVIRARSAADIYVEAPGGIFLPQPMPRAPAVSDGSASYIVDLTRAPDFKELPGKALRITAIGASGAVETTWVVK